jgi:hypothetical protein
MSETSQGSRVHPALVEARQQRIAFARLLTALRIPTGERSSDDGRTQSRGAVRGVCGIRGVSLRRRLKIDEHTPPERLVRYDSAEWGGDAQAFWDARDVWLQAHPDGDLPDDADAPDVPFDVSQI